MRHSKFLEKFMVFFFKCFLSMMLLLVQNIFADPVNLWMPIRKDSVTLLPMKCIWSPMFAPDKIIAFNLHLFYKIRNINRRLNACKNVYMIWHPAVAGPPTSLHFLPEQGKWCICATPLCGVWVKGFHVLLRQKQTVNKFVRMYRAYIDLFTERYNVTKHGAPLEPQKHS